MRELSHAGRHQAVHQDLIPAIRGRKPARTRRMRC
jgi:hypothetical protein